MSVYNYRLYCETEGTYVYKWDTVQPTTCPNNTAHTIDQTQTSIVSQISKNIIEIKEEDVPTAGNFQTSMVKLVVSGNSTSEYVWTRPFNVTAMFVYFVADETMTGDNVELLVAPDTVIGGITQDVSIGSNVLYVSETVLANVSLGYCIEITDGVNSEHLERIIGIDRTAGTITLENQTTNAYSASSPTYIKLTIRYIYDYEIGPPAKYEIGKGKIGGSSIPANVPVKVKYTNNTAITKTFRSYVEYIY